MRIPRNGEFRYHSYADDGGTIYVCNWCDRSIEIRENPEYGWNFCPKCGKSWFRKENCRPHEMPRWVWERGGEDYTGPWYPEPKKDTWEWVIETRTRWKYDTGWDPWTDWKIEQRMPARYTAKDVKVSLIQLKNWSGITDCDYIQEERRVRTRKIQ